ncbi:unnamed protein product [Phaedon cochleariae]|uniref:Acyltransferase 3 domain-containing protein n=1 Tax=Phaedon cochleariae TaxID=80249 RepID=A0A9N9SK46_PHACE|nr:unnamed protein product [Phaedon cochleariae]
MDSDSDLEVLTPPEMRENHSRVARSPDASVKPSSPSNPAGYKAGPLVYTHGPPFPVSFFMLRLHLNSSFTTEERVMHMGLCLPHACTDQDVKKIMEETSASSRKVTVKVEAVRSEHNRYNIWTDTTFIALCIAALIVIFLIVAGTGYDLYLENMKIAKMKAKNCFNGKFDSNMPDMKTKNGKCGLYIVNNNCNNNNNLIENHQLELNGNSNDSSSREPISRFILREMLLAFSARMNIRTICDQSVGSDTISVIHGLKAISMAWVILGHTCIIAFKYSDNMEYRRIVQKEFLFQTVTNGTFSVDTFFFTSGLLVSFLYFRTNAKGKLDPLNKGNGFVAGFLHFIGLIAYRFARLTVPYLFTVGLVEVSMKWFYYNSIFEPPTMDHVNCPNYWWRNVLYINTLFPVEEMCMLWSWYLSDDTQFYVIGAVMLILATSIDIRVNFHDYEGMKTLVVSPLIQTELQIQILQLYFRKGTIQKTNLCQQEFIQSMVLSTMTNWTPVCHFKSAASLLITFMLSSWITTGYIAYSNSHMPGSDDPLALFDKIYDKPWTRLGPYLIGMCTGWLLFKKNCRIHMPKVVIAIGWTASIAILLALVYGLYETTLSPWMGAAYSSLSHSAWAFGLAWIVVACVTGYGGVVNRLLSATILYPFSRVTYCAYLIHPITIRAMVMSMDSPLHLGSTVTIVIYLGQAVAAYFLSFFISVAFEAPIVSLLRIISKVAVMKKKDSPIAS